MNKRKKMNWWIGVIMLVIMTVLALYPQGENGLCVKAAEKLSFTEGNSYIITSKESKKVIEVADFGTYNGDKLQQWDYSKEESQQWQVKAEGSYYKFINKNSKKVLSTEEDAKNGSLLFQWEDTNADTQLWYVEETKDGYVQIKSKANKKCIDIAGISKDNGAKLQLWEDVDGDNQKWKFTEIKGNKKIVSGGKYKIISKNSKKAVETAYHSQKNGEVIQQWEYNDGESQQWYLEAVEDRYFKIINAYSSKAMTISGGNINNGTKILQNEYEGKDTQLWYFSEDDNGYYKIKSKRGHKCLEVSDISQDNGAKLQLWEDVNGDNQKWNLQLLEYQAIPYIDVDMYYNYNNNTYEVKWSGSKKITLSELYIRKNNSQKFEKYTTKEEKDEINEDDEKYYLENIEPEPEIRYLDIKIVGTSISGEKIESDIITAKVENEELEIVTRDTDGDRIPDGCEIWDLGTDPNNPDTDKDGFSDGYEVLILCTNPKEYTKNEDYDGDGTDNLEEVKNNTNPWINDLKFNQNYKLMDKQKENYNDINTAEFIKKGYYDVSIEMTNSDGTTFACIYNKLLKVYRYISTGENEKTWNVYDIDGHLTASVAYKDEKYNVNKYFYENNNLVNIVHNNMQYSMEYDDNNNMKEIAVGEQVLAKIEYNDSNLQKSIEYGNGQKAELVYEEDKVLALKVDGEKTVTFDYNKDNNVVSQQDLANQIEYRYTYDRNNNITGIKDTRGFEIKYNHADENEWGEEYQCNGINQFRQVMQSVQENSEKTVEVNISDNGKIETKYESDGSTREIKNNAGKTIISNITQKTDDKKEYVKNQEGQEITYEYDESGNLLSVKKDGGLLTRYEYDALNQLVREDNKEYNYSNTYQYDRNGNIVQTKKYKYSEGSLNGKNTTESHNYTYSDNWKDLLTEYDGNKITYDEIGNPLSYREGFVFQWEKGKMLSSVKNSENKIAYAYNSNGIRIKKDVNGIVTSYHVDGNKIISEKTGEDQKWYFYDENESVTAYQKGEKMYYYEKDKLDNIIGIYNEKGKKVVGYSYDAWGNLLSISGDKELGEDNPFRYRSYYYDGETGFYYLQTRYYDSITKRFLNTDSILGANGGENAYNLFHYCCNNPVKYEDPSGNWVVSVGVEANAAAIFGAYGSMQISFDDKTRFNISYSFGATIVFDVAAGISGFICVYPTFSNVSQVGGWAFATGASFSVGSFISAGGGGGITIAQDTIAPYVNVSVGPGTSLIKLPTIYVRVGYTWVKGGFNVKNIIKSYKKGQKKKYATKHGDVFIKKINGEYIEVYTSDIKRKARLYKNGKMKILNKQ